MTTEIVSRLDSYMRYRAFKEGVAYSIDAAHLQKFYGRGVRCFFGVQIAGGMLLRDEENPEAFSEYFALKH